MMEIFDLRASIMPGVELGGIKLHSHISSFERELNLSLASKKITAHVRTPSLVSYNYCETFSIIFDINNGNVSQLIARKLYKGAFAEDIRVGSKIEDILLKGYELLVDDFEGDIYLKGVPGINFFLTNPNFDFNDLPNQIISQITVYEPSLDDELLLQSFEEFVPSS